MINLRAAKITLDSACGVTHADLAREHGIGIARVGQIITETRRQLRMTGPMHTKEALGLAIVRARQPYRADDMRGDSPETFYWNELLPNRPASLDWNYL